MIRKLALLLIAVAGSTVLFAQNSIAFTFTVPAGPFDASTSAAVYDSTGAMVRWLWGNVTLPPGTYRRIWDGLLQNRTPATSGATYSIKLLMDNVLYTYDGALPDTQKVMTSTVENYATFTWQQSIGWMTFQPAGSKTWFTSGYSEGTINFGYFTTDMNHPQIPNANYQNGYIQFIDIATDNTWLYLLNVGGSGNPTWVTAVDAVTGVPVYFTSGTLVSGTAVPGWPKAYGGTPNSTWPNTTISTIDSSTYNVATNPTGLAVQRTGNLLAVAHGGQNQIKLFDKRLGTGAGTVTLITNPTWMAFNSEGLWVVSNGQLLLVTGIGSTNTITTPFPAGTFSNVVSVGTNGATGSIFVLDGGTHQQMYEYAANTHTLMRTYGDPGGYSNCDPTITNTKLMLDQTYSLGTSTAYRSWVRVADSDDVWLADAGTMFRILHISPANQYLERLLFLKPNYSVRLSHAQPNRLFVNFIEFNVDYTKPLVPGDPDPALGGNGSWTLAKNWAVCGGSAITGYSSPTAVEQLSNGRTYMAMYGPGVWLGVFELQASGPIRKTANVPVNFRGNLLRNGHLSYIPSATGTSPNYTINVMDQSPQTLPFDTNNDPQWKAAAVAATMTTNASNSFLIPDPGGPGSTEATSDGVYTFPHTAPYNSSATTYQPHLAGIKTGFPSFAWASLPEVCSGTLISSFPDYQGSYPCLNSYGGHNAINPAYVEGQNIFLCYDGQGATWGNQYFHLFSDGLMIGQFGQGRMFGGVNNSGQTPFVLNTWGFNYADIASNTVNCATAVVNGDIYLYHGVEGGIGGIHRWHISNLASIHEFAGSGILGVGTDIGNLIPISRADLGKAIVIHRKNVQRRHERRRERRN